MLMMYDEYGSKTLNAFGPENTCIRVTHLHQGQHLDTLF